MQIPDLHPGVVHFPIALLSFGSVAGLLYLYWKPRYEMRVLTWYPLWVGWLGALVAVATGLFAQSGLPPNAPYAQVLNVHVSTGFAVAILYAIPLYRQWLLGKRGPKGRAQERTKTKAPTADLLDEPSARGWLTAVFGVGLLLVLIVGASGGRLVFEWGVNVQTGL